MTTQSATGADSAKEVVRRIDAIRQLPDASARLVELLQEQSLIYAGRRTTEVERLRGRILASFEMLELPASALPFVLEELETGTNPWTVAAAGRALRGTAALPPEAFELVVDAISRLRGSDDVLPLEPLAPGSGGAITALADLASTLVSLGPRARSALPSLTALLIHEGEGFSPSVRATLATAVEALTASDTHDHSCCGAGHSRPSAQPHSAAGLTSRLAELELENQDSERLTLSEAFAGRPTALTFFYTRCMNPDKCSLTVTRLARLARLAEDEGLAANVAGISYDPRFDRPGRLKAYGSDRGMRFSAHCSLLRTTGPLDPLIEALQLGVGFGPVTVNRHRLELFVLDGSLRVTERFERRLWSEEIVLDALRAALSDTLRPAGLGRASIRRL